MKLSLIAFSTVVAVIINVPGLAQAQSGDIGKREFTERCAICHGVSGKGNGPLAGMITEKVADLTQISKKNKGVFPFAELYEVIDGSRDVRAHGTRDMPAWGSVYNAEVPQWLGMDYSPAQARSFVRGRILALIGYIQTLQEK